MIRQFNSAARQMDRTWKLLFQLKPTDKGIESQAQ